MSIIWLLCVLASLLGGRMEYTFWEDGSIEAQVIFMQDDALCSLDFQRDAETRDWNVYMGCVK